MTIQCISATKFQNGFNEIGLRFPVKSVELKLSYCGLFHYKIKWNHFNSFYMRHKFPWCKQCDFGTREL